MDKLSFLFFVGNFPDNGERRSPGTHIIESRDKFSGKQNPAPCGQDCSMYRRIHGIRHGKGHGGNRQHPIYGAVLEWRDFSPVQFVRPLNISCAD